MECNGDEDMKFTVYPNGHWRVVWIADKKLEKEARSMKMKYPDLTVLFRGSEEADLISNEFKKFESARTKRR